MFLVKEKEKEKKQEREREVAIYNAMPCMSAFREKEM
jgi:hypothetical protein